MLTWSRVFIGFQVLDRYTFALPKDAFAPGQMRTCLKPSEKEPSKKVIGLPASNIRSATNQIGQCR